MSLTRSAGTGEIRGTHTLRRAEGPRRRGRLRRFLGGLEPGEPVSPTLLMSSSPWTLPVLILLGLLVLAAHLGALTVEGLGLVRSWLPGSVSVQGGWHPLLSSLEITTALAGFVLLFTLPGWSWWTRVLIVFAAWLYATYNFGILSLGALEETIQWLASQPGVDVFAAPPPGAVDAMLALGFFVLLTPALGLIAMVLVWSWSAFAEEVFRPLGSRRVLPEWVVVVPVVGVLSGLAYAGNALWLPWALWVLGVVARAFLLVRG